MRVWSTDQPGTRNLCRAPCDAGFSFFVYLFIYFAFPFLYLNTTHTNAHAHPATRTRPLTNVHVFQLYLLYQRSCTHTHTPTHKCACVPAVRMRLEILVVPLVAWLMDSDGRVVACRGWRTRRLCAYMQKYVCIGVRMSACMCVPFTHRGCKLVTQSTRQATLKTTCSAHRSL